MGAEGEARRARSSVVMRAPATPGRSTLLDEAQG